MLSATLGAQALPAGPGAGVLEARCLGCHTADLIVSQRLSLAGWTREVENMLRWGAVLDTPDRDALQAYLAASFGPRPVPSHPATLASPPGAAIYQRACLACHGTDMVEQQRLSRTAWVREVEKMVRWNAIVSETEKDALADYLAGRFGVR
jgi:mono/diheme cytochrome c family protein